MHKTSTNNSRRRPIARGYSSHKAVTIASRPPNVLSNPSVINIRKNIMDQNTEPAIIAIASGYTINTKPGPSSPTRSIDFCWMCAIYLKTYAMQFSRSLSRSSFLKHTQAQRILRIQLKSSLNSLCYLWSKHHDNNYYWIYCS